MDSRTLMPTSTEYGEHGLLYAFIETWLHTMNDIGRPKLLIWHWAPNVSAPNEIPINQIEDFINEIVCLQQLF